MATIAKLPNGKFKAILKKNGKILKTKTFLKRVHARQWAKRIEADQEELFALGVPGEFALKPRWVADKVPYSGFANGSYPT